MPPQNSPDNPELSKENSDNPSEKNEEPPNSSETDDLTAPDSVERTTEASHHTIKIQWLTNLDDCP